MKEVSIDELLCATLRKVIEQVRVSLQNPNRSQSLKHEHPNAFPPDACFLLVGGFLEDFGDTWHRPF